MKTYELWGIPVNTARSGQIPMEFDPDGTTDAELSLYFYFP